MITYCCCLLVDERQFGWQPMAMMSIYGVVDLWLRAQQCLPSSKLVIAEGDNRRKMNR
jgi:hypothetical protein